MTYGWSRLRLSSPNPLQVVFWVAALCGENALAAGTWEPRAPLTVPRQETGSARIGDSVYVIGGLIGTAAVNTASVEAYDIVADDWSFVAQMPVGLDHMGCAAANGFLYAIGGYNAARTPQSGVYQYDPGADDWRAVASLPEPRAGCWAVAYEGKIYLFGGVNGAGSATASTYIFDPNTNTWSPGENMPTVREHLTATVAGRHIYVIGGRVGGASSTANERYNPRNNRWREMAPMPTARAASFTGSYDGRFIYVAGGETPQLFSVNEVYDVLRDSWSTDTAMAVPRHGLAAVATPDGILAPGGGAIQGLQPTAHTDLFVPDEALLPGAGPIALAMQFMLILLAGVAVARRRGGRRKSDAW